MKSSSTGRYPRYILSAITMICGILLVIGGALLTRLSGTAYYVLAGLALIVVGVLLWRGTRAARWVLGGATMLTLLWALWEVGWDIWGLIPRLDLIGLLWLLTLSLEYHRIKARAWERCAAVAITASLLAVPAIALWTGSSGEANGIEAERPAAGSQAGTRGDWQHFGGGDNGQRYSEIAQIDTRNVAHLQPAWTFEFTGSEPEGLQVTPIEIGNLVYACNGINQVVALNAATGRQQWLFDPAVDVTKSPFKACRGVGYYEQPEGTGGICRQRIIITTIDARMIAVDALSGQRCPAFGREGEVSLLEGLGNWPKGYYSFNGAPTIADGKIIVGGTIADNQMWGEPSGVIRAFDAVSGRLAWAYDVGAPDRVGPPPPGSFYTPSTPNAWGQMAFDSELGLLYVPTGNATPDYYGAQRRPIDDEISSAIIALDIRDGRRRWIFQTVHHDVWDYDVGSQPVLVDLPRPGGVTRAVVQVNKRAEIFLLDRATGKPLSRVIERPAPQAGNAPGERLSPTQPHSADLPVLDGGRLTETSMWGLTPFDQLWCRIRFKETRYDGPMTPPGPTHSIQYPGYLGGMDWGSASIDPNRGVMIAVTNHVANYVRLVPRAEADAKAAWAMGFGREGILSMIGINAQKGTPYGSETKPFLSPLEIPCQQPPWGRLNAIDLKTKKVLWSVPLGTGQESGPFGLRSHMPVKIGVPSLGGALVTRGGLTFVGASTDKTLRAVETKSGRLLWQSRLPDSANATPITYTAGSNGKQYILVAAAGHKGLGSHLGDKLVAFALPD